MFGWHRWKRKPLYRSVIADADEMMERTYQDINKTDLIIFHFLPICIADDDACGNELSMFSFN